MLRQLARNVAYHTHAFLLIDRLYVLESVVGCVEEPGVKIEPVINGNAKHEPDQENPIDNDTKIPLTNGFIEKSSPDDQKQAKSEDLDSSVDRVTRTEQAKEVIKSIIDTLDTELVKFDCDSSLSILQRLFLMTLDPLGIIGCDAQMGRKTIGRILGLGKNLTVLLNIVEEAAGQFWCFWYQFLLCFMFYHVFKYCVLCHDIICMKHLFKNWIMMWFKYFVYWVLMLNLNLVTIFQE